MLKSRFENEVRLVQQHHHAQLSGYLAAHWGGVHGFARPGHFPGASDPARWRDEVVLGIAEHDNGWWEWEAMPRISDLDGLPVGVGEAAKPTRRNELAEWRSGGFERWRRGVDRLAEAHPYAALLVSLHAYWLYAVAFDDLTPPDADLRRHPVFGAPELAAALISDPARTRRFLAEQAARQATLREQLARDPVMERATEPRHLDPHFRLLQVLDSLSLFLALHDLDDHRLREVPRASHEDRCEIAWWRLDSGTVAIDPYPFDLDPLPVHLPVRRLPVASREDGALDDSPLARLHGAPLETVEIRLVGVDSRGAR